MSDVQHSVSCISGNQKCENKPYTLKETLHLKKIDIIICTIKKKVLLHTRINIQHVRVSDLLFYVKICTATCQSCENGR